MDIFEVRGVPVGMRQDGWWLSVENEGPRKRMTVGEGPWLRVLLLIALIALADILLWDVTAGVSIAVFGVALVTAAILVIEPQMKPRRLALCAMTTFLSVLPIIEIIQPLSVLLLTFGIALTLAIIAGLKPHQLGRGAMRLFWIGPLQTAADGWSCATKGPKVSIQKQHIQSAFLGWGVPIVLTCIFALLFAQANPVLDTWLINLIPEALPAPNPVRWIFWAFIAMIAWPCLILWRLQERLRAARHTVQSPRAIAVINAASILRSLVMFNLLFAVQTGMDIFYLYGGGDLPDGMNFAKYAHRGAYPLVVTALLAGVFALISKPFAKDLPVLRILLLIWVVQNLALVCGSLVRLELYVDSYGLTHWRIAALIWMGLVAFGLSVLWLQIWKDHSNTWMLLRVGFAACFTLYICVFVSFDRVIAQYNLSHVERLDKQYICQLGEAALPVIKKHSGKTAKLFCQNVYPQSRPVAFIPNDWREWGFRNWRVRRSLNAMNEATMIP